MPTKLKFCGFYLVEEDKVRLEELATKRRTTISKLVGEVMANYLDLFKSIEKETKTDGE
jgi:hypothetical protein